MNQTISDCGPEDLADVSAVVNAAYRGEGGVSGWTSEVGLVAGPRISVAALTEDLASSVHVSILALRQGSELLACVRREYMESPSKVPLCYISMLAVHPRAQDRGLGRVLLRHAEVQGHLHGARAVRLTVVSIRDSLIAWYERQGYVRTGEKGIPYQDVRFGTPLRSDLEFVWLEKTLDVKIGRAHV
jgi:ribosomal protein S18 acetylase RimI-like enzyme